MSANEISTSVGVGQNKILEMARYAAETSKRLDEADLSQRFHIRKEVARAIIRRPDFADMVKAHSKHLLFAQGLPSALNYLVTTIQCETAAPTDRIKAAIAILGRTLPDAKTENDSHIAKDLTDLSADQLRDVIDGLEEHLSSKAKVIDAQPFEQAEGVTYMSQSDKPLDVMD